MVIVRTGPDSMAQCCCRGPFSIMCPKHEGTLRDEDDGRLYHRSVPDIVAVAESEGIDISGLTLGELRTAQPGLTKQQLANALRALAGVPDDTGERS